MKKGIYASAIAAILVGLGQQVVAGDSVRPGAPADVPWQLPNARALNGKAENQLNVNSANTATSAATASYANNAGALGGKGEGQLNVATSGTASYVPSTGITGITTCAAGYVLQKTTTGFLCVNTIATATTATTAGNGVANVSGSKIGLANGTQYDLPSGGGGSTCTGVFSACASYRINWFGVSCGDTPPPAGVSSWVDTGGCSHVDTGASGFKCTMSQPC